MAPMGNPRMSHPRGQGPMGPMNPNYGMRPPNASMGPGGPGPGLPPMSMYVSPNPLKSDQIKAFFVLRPGGPGGRPWQPNPSSVRVNHFSIMF